MARKLVIRLLLRLLNSRWLNSTPCSYGFIGNVDAFSLAYLESEDHQRPGITVRTILEEAARFRSCPLSIGLVVLEGGAARPATEEDVADLQREFSDGA